MSKGLSFSGAQPHIGRCCETTVYQAVSVFTSQLSLALTMLCLPITDRQTWIKLDSGNWSKSSCTISVNYEVEEHILAKHQRITNR